MRLLGLSLPIFCAMLAAPTAVKGDFVPLRTESLSAPLEESVQRNSALNAASASPLSDVDPVLLAESFAALSEPTADSMHGELTYFVNPEPSSVLVWCTTLMGVIAAGYGIRRRNDHDINPSLAVS